VPLTLLEPPKKVLKSVLFFSPVRGNTWLTKSTKFGLNSGEAAQMKCFIQLSLAGLVLASLAVHVVERRRISGLRQANEALREERAAAQQLIEAKSNDQSGPEELERLRSEAREVHKLRNEVSQLRAGMKEADQLRAENQRLRAAGKPLQAAPGTGLPGPAAPASQEGYYAKENWAFIGYATPEAALQSVIWAMREGDTRTLLASVTPEEMERMQKEWGSKSEAQVSADAKRGTDKISGIRILESKTLSDDEVVLCVYAAGGEDKVQKISMKRSGAEWKMAGPKRE